ncbi:hypothetical protein MD588_10495 [Photobacterium sp. SDRW27]|uniref:hypothetical protein n=1 Tax=Photobacterium obscurum TaxID=2829490 RepID=UPI002242D86D|nr:hypothetical protein [Photobacterium obscurum]MCW8329235.1 hypothetical protein [Photobacterium obscurum]
MESNKVKIGCLSPLVMALAIMSLPGCNSNSAQSAGHSNQTAVNSNGLSAQTLELGITSVPENLSVTFSSKLKFNRYTKVMASNGKAIHIVAQDKLSDNQIVRARSILEHYLAPYSGSVYGANKTAIANKMTENNATLLLLNGSDDGTNPAAELDGQPLYQNEIQVEGHSWYINQNYDHRDAAFEEILHMVHDYGIGVDQNERFVGALPAYQAEIRSAQVRALTDNLWGIGSGNKAWIQELTAENSLSQEYLAAVVDSFYGLWGAWSGSNTNGMWGLYIAKTRAEISSEDMLGAQLMANKFFHPYLTYNARIDESFKGDFSLRLDPKKPYTHHSQYLKDVTLTGSNASNVIVNQFDNKITGNSGTNKVLFSGNSSQYIIDKQQDGIVVITDLVDSRDGVNTVNDIEELVFNDVTVFL